MSKVIRVGTRKSALAVAQTMLVVEAMKQASPGLLVELVKKQTIGDQILDKPLLSFGGKGVFVSEFEQALLDGEIDFAVHSAKDLPMELAVGLEIVGIPAREDPRDVLVSLAGRRPQGSEAVIGTSSLRRKLQIERLGAPMWPDCFICCENLRGNVQTRLKKLENGEYDGILLAAAGLKRLGLEDNGAYEYHYFDCDTFIPAGGQGILAIEGRCKDPVNELAAMISDETAKVNLTLERQILKLLNAGCHEPIGVYSVVTGEQVTVYGISQRGEIPREIVAEGSVSQLEALAKTVARELTLA